MSVVFSGSWSGSFTSAGTPYQLALPSGWNSIKVRNETIIAAGGAGSGAEFYFRRGMTNGSGIIYTKEATIGALVPTVMAAPAGFLLMDTSSQLLGPAVATTGINGALPPVVTTGSTAAMIANTTIVRIYNPIGALQLGGMDFTVGAVVANTSFTLRDMPAIVAATPAAGAYRIVAYGPYFYPSTRYITKISSAVQAIVTLSVTHNYVVGQKLRFKVPQVTALAFGMTALNDVEATIVAVNVTDGTSTNTITVDVDTTGMTAYALPLSADPGFTPAMVIPYGDNMVQSLLYGTNPLADSVYNAAISGLILMPGVGGPAGVNTNVISWTAYKSFNG